MLSPITTSSRGACLRAVALVVLAAALSSAACEGQPGCEGRPGAGASATAIEATSDEALTQREEALLLRLSPLDEVPADETNAVVDDERAARLGQFLFFDERLSANEAVSCASCHRPEEGFAMAARLGEGLARTPRHPPTLLNAAFQHWYNWDGSTDSLWAQAIGPLENPAEMGFTRAGLAHLIADDAELRAAYEAIFGELPPLADIPPAARPVPDDADHPHHQAWQAMAPDDQQAVNGVLANVAKALAAYQTRLVRADAPFDTFVEGLRDGDPQKLEALSAPAKRGAKLFLGEAGCVRCHTGPNFSDGSFHNLGLGPRDWLPEADEGRWEGVTAVKKSAFNAAGAFSDDAEGKRARWNAFLTRTPEDHGQFKTPTLRNVELTAPYMHGGHFETLEEVVRFYMTLGERPRLGHREEMLEPLALDARDVDDLVAFMKSLTGRPLPETLMHPPAKP